MRRQRSRISNFGAGLIAAIVILVACYLVFGGSVPFSGSPFVLKALFTSETELHIPSPVRIAGVDVGQVVSVQRLRGGGSAAVIRMEINRNGLPIHADATAEIRPRIFLEGNFYVDLHPGTPGAPALGSGATLAAGRTSGPVQLDRLLSSLNGSARANLQTLFQGLGSSLNDRPGPGEDLTQDPIVRGLTGGQGLNLSLNYSADAFRASAIVNQALLGIQPHDLAKVISGNERFFHALAASGDQLAGFVSTFDATMATLASRQQQLSQTLAALPPLLRSQDRALSALDSSFAPTRAFAKDIIPGLRQLDPTIGVALPWLAQSTALFSPSEFGGLLAQLTPATQDTSNALTATIGLLRASDLLGRCFSHNLVPAGNEVIADGPASSGLRIYQELFQVSVGLAGAAGNFDGNGRYVRASAGGGNVQVQTQTLPVNGPLFGNVIYPVLGTRPAWPGKTPPLRRDVPCYRNAVPNLNQVQTGTGP